MYKSLDEKRKFFENGEDDSFIIDTEEVFNDTFYKINSFSNPKNQIPLSYLKMRESDEVIDHTQFHYNQANTASILIDLVQESINKAAKSDSYFRGLPEAKYSLTTTGQREWALSRTESYSEFIINGFQNTSNHGLFRSILEQEQSEVSTSVFGLFSLIRFNGGFTTLLDFTIDPNIAFYFAIEPLKQWSKSKDNVANNQDIDNYFSIYMFVRTSGKSSKGSNNKNETVNLEDIKIAAVNLISGWDSKDISLPIVFISDFIKNEVSKPLTSFNVRLRSDHRFVTFYNKFIIPQLGVFFLNYHESLGLEHLLIKRKVDKEDDSSTQLHCFNINKKLILLLDNLILKKNKINHQYLYPNLDAEIKKLFKTQNSLL